MAHFNADEQLKYKWKLFSGSIVMKFRELLLRLNIDFCTIQKVIYF